MNENDFDDNLRTGAIWSEVKIWDQMVLNSEQKNNNIFGAKRIGTCRISICKNLKIQDTKQVIDYIKIQGITEITTVNETVRSNAVLNFCKT